MKIYIGSDHRGFKMKEEINKWLQENNYEFEDVGALKYEKEDDYPVFAEKLGKKVVNEHRSMGILLCGSGAGAVAAVNKIKGIRASVGILSEQIHAARNDDDLNVLVIAADFTNKENSKDMVKTFLKTDFDTSQERYQRRIDQITKLEND